MLSSMYKKYNMYIPWNALWSCVLASEKDRKVIYSKVVVCSVSVRWATYKSIKLIIVNGECRILGVSKWNEKKNRAPLALHITYIQKAERFHKSMHDNFYRYIASNYRQWVCRICSARDEANIPKIFPPGIQTPEMISYSNIHEFSKVNGQFKCWHNCPYRYIIECFSSKRLKYEYEKTMFFAFK